MRSSVLCKLLTQKKEKLVICDGGGSVKKGGVLYKC